MKTRTLVAILVVVTLLPISYQVFLIVGGGGDGGAGNAAPSANFTVSPSTPAVDQVVTLDASASTDPDGEVVSYEWDFDDDGSFTDEAEHVDDVDDDIDGGDAGPNLGRTSVAFDSAGRYTVVLRVTDDGGATDTVSRTITVTNQRPEASFTVTPATPVPDAPVVLDASGSTDPDGDVVRYEWDFDSDGEFYFDADGSGVDDLADEYDGSNRSTSPTARVAFETGGEYTVTLRVVDNGGLTDTVTRTITVVNEPPVPRFEYAVSPTDGLALQVNARGSFDEDGQVERYQWFVDGRQAASGAQTTVTFPEKGTYRLRLVVTDNGAATGTLTKNVTVSEHPNPSVSYAPMPVVVGREVVFSGADSSDPDGTIVGYEWQFAGGATDRGETVTRTFTEPGPQQVTLTVVDDTGNRQNATRQFEVRTPPDASFTWRPTDPTASEPVQFRASASANVTAYEWDFDDDGDFEDATGRRVSHTFTTAGDYPVSLRVTDDAGVQATETRTVVVASAN